MADCVIGKLVLFRGIVSFLGIIIETEDFENGAPHRVRVFFPRRTGTVWYFFRSIEDLVLDTCDISHFQDSSKKDKSMNMFT
jgi:hypothetical protein